MFNFNSIDFSVLNTKVVEIKRPLIAPQRISTTTIEGKAEEIFHRRVSSSYNIDVEFYLFSANGLALLSDIRELAGMLDSESPAKLIFNDESDKFLMALVESTDIERKGRYAICTVSFKILDPYLYAVIDDVHTYTTPGSKAIVRKGNAESYPMIEIEGVSSASGFYTVGANGSQMKYTGALAAGEKLIFDSSLLTAYILTVGGVKKSAMNNLLTLDFPVLTKGNNTFVIGVGNGASLTKCKLTCNSRWK